MKTEYLASEATREITYPRPHFKVEDTQAQKVTIVFHRVGAPSEETALGSGKGRPESGHLLLYHCYSCSSGYLRFSTYFIHKSSEILRPGNHLSLPPIAPSECK